MKKFFLLFCLPLLMSAADVPLFTVNPADGVPRIDGVLDPQEWGNSVELANFIRIGDSRFAAEPTRVMVRAAGDMLCFGFRFNEYALDKFSNQYKTFRAGLKGRNQPVWNNDSMEMRIAPPWIKDQSFFYIAFSAGGATKVKVPKGFSGDVESKLRLAVKEYNGFWSAELAIPFASLGARPEGDWKINFVRFEKRIPEDSSYCPLLTGEHGNLGKHAVMRFSSRPVPVVREEDYGKLPSLVKLPVTLSGPSWNGSWKTFCSGRTKTGKMVSPGKFAIEVPPLEAGSGTAVLEIGGFYRSPAYPLTKASSRLKLLSSSEIKGTFNRRSFRGRAATLYPEDGINRLAVTLPPGQSLELGTDTELGLPVQWSFSEAGIKSAVLEKGMRFTNPSAKNIELSTEFFHRGSKFLPPGVDRQTMHLTEDGTYIFLWDILNTAGWDFSRPLEKTELHLYLPDSVELLGVDNRVKYPDGFKKLGWPKDKQFYQAEKLAAVKILGKTLQHWVIRRSEPVRFEYIKSLRHHQAKRERACIFLRGRKGYAGSGDGFACWHMSAFGGKLGEAVQMISVKVHPELKGGKVPDLTMSLMNYWADDLQDSRLTGPFYQTLISAGVNEVIMDSRFAPPLELRYNARIELERINWRNTYPDFEAFMKKHPESRIINHKGNREDVLSMSHLLDHPELHPEFFMVLVKLKQDHPGIGSLFVDMEDDPFKSRYGGDYSPASLRRFAARFRIKDKLTPEIIRTRYGNEWISFRPIL